MTPRLGFLSERPDASARPPVLLPEERAVRLGHSTGSGPPVSPRSWMRPYLSAHCCPDPAELWTPASPQRRPSHPQQPDRAWERLLQGGQAKRTPAVVLSGQKWGDSPPGT